MYEEFYGLRDKPFNLSPDPRFYFESSGHARALSYLHYGVEQGEGFVVVTGDIGTGKTTIARMLHDELVDSREVVVVQLAITHCTGNELLRMVADGFDVGRDNRSKATVLRELDTFLREQRAAGRRALLLIDEVQNLPMEALEMLRMLSNFQVGGQSLIQSLLLGQAEFRKTLNSPKLEQFRQRVVASCHLDPLPTSEETRAYIEHRLRHVGWKGDPSIGQEAFDSIHQFTNGVPRRINTFFDRLLLYSFLEGLHEIGRETVEAVGAEIVSDFPAAAGTSSTQGGDSGSSEVSQNTLEERVCALERAVVNVHNGIRRALQQRDS